MKIKAYLDTLTVDQLRTVCRIAERKIKAAEGGKRKVIWHVEEGGFILESFREEDYEAALQYLKKALDGEGIIRSMQETIKAGKRLGYLELPKIVPSFENEVEYEEWFK
jgi:glycerol-3-phosphate responsive antiterminator